MQVWTQEWRAGNGAATITSESENTDIVLYFGARDLISDTDFYPALRDAYPKAHILGCSTGTAIRGVDLDDDMATIAAVSFEHSTSKLAKLAIKDKTSFEAGSTLAEQLADPNLVGVLVLSDGLAVNGSELVAGMQSVLGPDIPVSGGLAGDGAAFEKTLVGADCAPVEGIVAALGLYGDRLAMRLGAAHGWDNFGPPRRITKSEGNVLHEMDNKPALGLYKRYLGDEAEQLPASALLYPLLISNPDDPSDQVVRTVLSVDHDKSTMTFAGDVPTGWNARLMRGVFDNLTAGAAAAARSATPETIEGKAGFALLVSCVGRRILMGQRTADEIEATAQALGDNFEQVGFYSYGEIATKGTAGHCGLHNQTMTVLTLCEA